MGKKTSKQSSGPSKTSLPYLKAGSTAITDAYTGNQANVANITGLLNSNIPSVLGQTLNNPALGAASSYDQDVLGGKYLTGNPFLQQQIDATNSDVANKVNGAIGTRGLTGGSAQTQILADSLAKNETGLRYQDYTNERANMNTAAGNATSVAGAGNSGIQSLLAYLSGTAELPGQIAGQYAQGLGSLWGNSTTQKSTPSAFSNLLGLAGAGASIAGAI